MSKKILIIGHHGLLSLSLQTLFNRKSIQYATTSSKVSCIQNDSACITFDFDLKKNIADQFAHINLEDFSHAIICGGIAKLDYCYKYPEFSTLINEINTIDLCHYLLERNVIPVYCSSDLVFDGTKGNYHEDDICHPINEYGRQKRSVEQFLINYLDQCLILRFSKLYSISTIDTSPIRELFYKLSQNNILNCAIDLTISPTNVDEICAAMLLLIQEKKTGIYHLSPGQNGKYNRYEFAMKFATRLHKTELIHCCHIADLHLPFKLGQDNSLNNTRFSQEFQFHFTTLDENFTNIWNFYTKEQQSHS